MKDINVDLYLIAHLPHYSHLEQSLHATANEIFNFQVQISTDMRQLKHKLFRVVVSQRESLHQI